MVKRGSSELPVPGVDVPDCAWPSKSAATLDDAELTRLAAAVMGYTPAGTWDHSGMFVRDEATGQHILFGPLVNDDQMAKLAKKLGMNVQVAEGVMQLYACDDFPQVKTWAAGAADDATGEGKTMNEAVVRAAAAFQLAREKKLWKKL